MAIAFSSTKLLREPTDEQHDPEYRHPTRQRRGLQSPMKTCRLDWSGNTPLRMHPLGRRCPRRAVHYRRADAQSSWLLLLFAPPRIPPPVAHANYELSLALVAFVGIVQTAYFSMNGALLLGHVDEAYRGRVLSIYDTDRGLIPLGALLLGGLATWIGTPEAVALLALPIIPIALVVLWRVPRFRATQ